MGSNGNAWLLVTLVGSGPGFSLLFIVWWNK